MNEFIYEVITSAIGEKVVKRTDAEGNEAWIPVDPTNSDYVAYLESVNDDTETE